MSDKYEKPIADGKKSPELKPQHNLDLIIEIKNNALPDSKKNIKRPPTPIPHSPQFYSVYSISNPKKLFDHDTKEKAKEAKSSRTIVHSPANFSLPESPVQSAISNSVIYHNTPLKALPKKVQEELVFSNPKMNKYQHRHG